MHRSHLDRRSLLKSALSLPAGLLSAQGAAPRPNIVFILADDLGIGGLSCYGADKFQTPNIDSLARGGIRFTNGYTAPLCGPSRALMMTGRYAFRTGATNQDATGLMKPSVETMIPKVLKSAGYASLCVGKWGQLPAGPAAFGFDEHLQFRGSGSYWNSQSKAKRYLVNGQERDLPDGRYLPDAMHDYLVDFIRRRRDNPFFAFYSMSHVHAEILPTPDSAPDTKDHYADNIRYMDKLVGKLVAELDRLRLREKTLIVFVGDNGTGGNYSDISTIRGRRLSGEKGSMLEGGALVPLIANWRGTTPAGQVSGQLIDSTDFLPTFNELAGSTLPPVTMDGQSFASTLRGRPDKQREWIYIQLARQWYVRDSQWKLDQSGKLYDMRQAPFEEPLAKADDPGAAAARRKLQAALDKLNPAGGIVDQGDGSGRHAGRAAKKKA